MCISQVKEKAKAGAQRNSSRFTNKVRSKLLFMAIAHTGQRACVVGHAWLPDKSAGGNEEPPEPPYSSSSFSPPSSPSLTLSPY